MRGQTLASASFACQTLPDSDELLDAMGLEAPGCRFEASSASLPVPECLPLGTWELDSCTLWLLLSLQMPGNRFRQLQKYGLIAPAKLVGPFNCQRILLPNASRFRSLLASSLHKTPGRPFSSLMSKQSTLVRVTRPLREAGAWFVKIVKHWFSNSLTGYH